ncbi:MAG: FtsX-like permease family protein [Candidatus Bathyarchaeota archaeon]|jgi:ABC-type antimicrobial peptide transport system permease subunit
MSEISFPIKDLSRRRTQTALTVLGLTISTAATVFLIIFGTNLGFEIIFFARAGRLTSGFSNIFFQFILFVSILNLLTGPVITSFLVHLTMSGRMRDIGVMKASGCLSGSIFAYFATELSLLVFLSTLAGIISGIAAFYASTIFLNFAGFSISQTLDPAVIMVICIVLLIFSHLSGALPIRRAAKAKPTEAMSPIYKLGTTAALGKKAPSRLGLTFRMAFRSLLRRKTATSQAIICLSMVLTLATVTIAGGIVANQTTASYVERAIGRNIVLVGHPTLTDHYVSLLSQFFEDKELEQIDWLDSEFVISESLVNKMDDVHGISVVDPRFVLEKSVRSVPGIILDPIDQTGAVIVGSKRVDDALILGVESENIVNDWLIFGRKLGENDQDATMVGDSLAVNMFSIALNQSIKVFDESLLPYDIVGVCVDPLNNGKVVYMPIETLYNDHGQHGYNLLLLQVDESDKQQVLAQIENVASAENLEVVELDAILDKHVNFLNNVWSLVMLLPIFSLATAVISLLSYLMLSVSGQQHEFGVMRALGAKPRCIMKIVFSQAAMIILVSGAIGISAGLFITFRFLIPNPVLSQATLISLSAGLLAVLGLLCVCSLYPALKAVKKTVVDTISTVE